jgi:hypothetical protein
MVIKVRPMRKVDDLTAICESIVQKMWKPRRLTNLRASMTSYRDSFTLFFYVSFKYNSVIIRYFSCLFNSTDKHNVR